MLRLPGVQLAQILARDRLAPVERRLQPLDQAAGLDPVAERRLDQERLQKLKALEQELGAWVVAVEPQATVAELPPDKLKRLQQAEQELGVILLAYNSG